MTTRAELCHRLSAPSSLIKWIASCQHRDCGTIVKHGTFQTRQFNGQPMDSFSDIEPSDVLKLINKLPNKSSPRDALPTSLLKMCADIFSPVIASLANITFRSGEFPSLCKTAQVLPLIKKSGLDQFVPINYWPNSNLHTVSKFIERLVLVQLKPHFVPPGSSICFNQRTALATRRKPHFRRYWTVSTRRLIVKN